MPTEVVNLLSSDDDLSITRSNVLTRPSRPKNVYSNLQSGILPSSDELDVELALSPQLGRRHKRRRLSPVDDPIVSSNPTASNANTQPSSKATSIPQLPKPRAPRQSLPDDPLDLEPIAFTSSPAPYQKQQGNEKPRTEGIRRSPRGRQQLANDLSSSCPSSPDSNNVTASISSASLKEVSSNIKPTRPKPKPKSTNKASATATTSKATSEKKKTQTLSAAERAAARAAKAQEKQASKEEAAASKKLERERKAQEKQREKDLAEANRARHDKRVSAPEMVVELPAAMSGKSVDTKVRAMLENLGVEVATRVGTGVAGDGEIAGVRVRSSVVKWRRKVRVRFDEELGYWVPVPLKVVSERHIMCFVEAKDFVGMLDEGTPEAERLDACVGMLKGGEVADVKVIFLIEGMEAYVKKSRNAKNREYTAAVRGVNPSGSKKKKSNSEVVVNVDEGKIEDALLRLQVVHECLIYHTASNQESAEWIVHFTQHISTIPYRNVRDNISTSFCMDVGQVRTGDDAGDTYVKMLQQIVRVTAPIAYGIAREYTSVEILAKGFEEKGSLLLENLKKGANRDGAVSDARIGPAISKRLEKVFMGKNPASQDI